MHVCSLLKYNLSFLAKVSFSEKTKQGQQCLKRDFPCAHVFKNVVDVVPDTYRDDVLSADNSIEKVCNILGGFRLMRAAPCVAHDGICQIPTRPDLSLFGAPCVDDSQMGSCLKEDGCTRRV